jgi:hypothetical protein
MGDCDYCGKQTDGLPHTCKYCGGSHCSDHLLPENHNCEGLKEQKKRTSEKWKNNVSDIFSSKKEERGGEYSMPLSQYIQSSEADHRHHKRRRKGHSKRKRTKKNWLMRRKHYRYDFETSGKNLLIFIVSVVGFLIFYSNAQKLNGVDLWILNLGSILILVSLFFTIKYGWRLLEEGVDFFKRQRNYVKCLAIIFIMLLVWQGYVQEEAILDYYNNNIDLSLLVPLSFEETEKLLSNIVEATQEDPEEYRTSPKTVKLSGVGDFVVYGGVNSYLSQIDRSISYYYDEPTTKDFVLKDLNNKVQRAYLISLVDEIKSKSSDPKKQADISINLVQRIPYDWDSFNNNDVDGRYPYEVLYDEKGVCMEKADLLAFLLRELGFGVAIFEYDAEDHRAIGIQCEKGNYNTNYCFIESTSYYPIGSIPSGYVGGADIRNANPEVVVISSGLTYPKRLS